MTKSNLLPRAPAAPPADVLPGAASNRSGGIARHWDIFCQVIDNHGDLGVCWRLAADLAARGHGVRLWADDPAALAWMAPEIPPGITCLHWRHPPGVAGSRLWPSGQALATPPQPADVVIEGFGCAIDASYMASAGTTPQTRPGRYWINLEYLSAESYVARSHGLPSPVMSGPAAGQRKYFFFPGFTADTGGLLREPDLAARQQAFDAPAWLDRNGIRRRPGELLASLFCYEPAALPAWLRQLADAGQPTRLLVTAGRARAAVAAALADWPGAAPGHPPDETGSLSITELPYLPQTEYDHLLWSADFNLVRGEDSLVRAIWAGKPFVWHIYPQHDGAHWHKLDAFLDLWLDGAPAATASLVRDWHHSWNAATQAPPPAPPPVLEARQLSEWGHWAGVARTRLAGQEDLVTRLIRFIGQTG